LLNLRKSQSVKKPKPQSLYLPIIPEAYKNSKDMNLNSTMTSGWKKGAKKTKTQQIFARKTKKKALP